MNSLITLSPAVCRGGKEGLLIWFPSSWGLKGCFHIKDEFPVGLQITSEIGSSVTKLFATSYSIYRAPFPIVELQEFRYSESSNPLFMLAVSGDWSLAYERHLSLRRFQGVIFYYSSVCSRMSHLPLRHFHCPVARHRVKVAETCVWWVPILYLIPIIKCHCQ